MDIYRAGFIGATVQDATKWIGEQAESAHTICVPFAGTGRDIASMAHEGACIESWDTQYYSKCIIEGIFAARTMESAVDQLHYRKGWMYETRSIKYIDDRCAGFIDWVGAHGTLFDKASLGSAIVRCTLMGRMTQWYANIEQLWSRFNRARDNNRLYVGLPGKFVHHYGSFFDAPPETEYDLMQVDPPKVVMGSDVYSANFNPLNRALAQTDPDVIDLPRWNWRDVLGHFRTVMEVRPERTIFMYVSKVRPSYDEVKKVLFEYADLEEEREFSHNGRTDYALVLRRRSG